MVVFLYHFEIISLLVHLFIEKSGMQIILLQRVYHLAVLDKRTLLEVF